MKILKLFKNVNLVFLNKKYYITTKYYKIISTFRQFVTLGWIEGIMETDIIRSKNNCNQNLNKIKRGIKRKKRKIAMSSMIKKKKSQENQIERSRMGIV